MSLVGYSPRGRKELDMTQRLSTAQQQEIKKRWQEYIEEYTKKGLDDLNTHDGAVTHLEPDILECEIKGTLGSFTIKKLVEVTEFQLSYFKS